MTGRLKITFAALAALLALACFGYGCGGGGGDASGSDAVSAVENEKDIAPALQKTEFIEAGDAICTKVPRGYEKLVEPLEKENEAKGKGKPPVAEVNMKAAVPPLEKAIDEFNELEIPEGEEKASEEIIEALEAAKQGVEEKPNTKLSGPESPFDDFQNMTRAYGFSQCNRL